MEPRLNEENSLQLIESMINKAKNNFSESGSLYLLLGFVVFICSIVQFTGEYFYNYDDIYYVWYLTWIVVIYQAFFIARKRKVSKVRTYTEDIVKYVWICFLCCITLMIYILIYQKAFWAIDPAILVLYGLPTFLSGIILKFKPLIIGAISCWLLSVISVFFENEFQVLFISLAVLIAWIIPGYLLRVKFKKEH